MQIHELTQARSQVTEGVWDTLRAVLASDPKMDGMTLAQKEAYIKQGALVQNVANKANAAWGAYSAQLENSITDPAQLDQFKKRRNKTYENALRAFVQKNLLAGLPYDRLMNRSQIEALIKAMSLPGNSSPTVQAPLWQQMAQATSVSQVEALAPDVAPSAKAINVNKAAQSIQSSLRGATNTDLRGIGQYLSNSRKDAWHVLSKEERSKVVRDVAKALTGMGVTVSGYNPGTTPGSAVTALSAIAASAPGIKTTGNPSLDAVLTSLGFTII